MTDLGKIEKIPPRRILGPHGKVQDPGDCLYLTHRPTLVMVISPRGPDAAGPAFLGDWEVGVVVPRLPSGAVPASPKVSTILTRIMVALTALSSPVYEDDMLDPRCRACGN